MVLICKVSVPPLKYKILITAKDNKNYLVIQDGSIRDGQSSVTRDVYGVFLKEQMSEEQLPWR